MGFGNKIHSKSISKWHATWNVSFCLHSKRQDARKTASWLPRTRQKGPQDGSKTDPDTLRIVQTAPSCSWGSEEALQASMLDPPDLDVGPSRRIFSILQTLICILSNIELGAVAGTQLCCALDSLDISIFRKI